MKKISTIFILTLLLAFSSSSWCQKIVYPWRATTAIVKSGESFEVWFNPDAGQTVNSIELKGPYNTVTGTITNSNTQPWVYDKWSENTCNRRITVKVPADAPMDRYDLILKTSTGDEISLAAVKVIKEYKNSFYIMHMSDAHRWQGGYDTPNIVLKEISTIIDIANIIDPEMIIETGDNHYQNLLVESSTRSRIDQYMNGFMNGSEYVNGMNNFFAPVFSVPGNHDTPRKGYEFEPEYPSPGYEKNPSIHYNKFYGLQAYNFKYGNVRFIGVNNSWFPDNKTGTPNFSHQTDEAVDWLSKVGNGVMRIGFAHVNTSEPLAYFYDPLKAVGAPLDLIMVGHSHSITNSPHTVDGKKIAYTTLTPREGTRKVPFNLYKIDAVAGTYETIGNEQAIQEGVTIAKDYSTVKLKLTYSKPNDGTSNSNIATINNKFNFPISGARVRFVVPKGSPYYLTNATVKQDFDGTNFHIVDAVVDLVANDITEVKINAGVPIDNCPSDPNKMDPGFCGCGVPEGTCAIVPTGITLAPSSAKINIATTRQFTAVIAPKYATERTVIWESSNAAIASVSNTGLVTAIAEGTATITAKTFDGSFQSSSTITVINDVVNYQAEYAEFVGPVEVSNQPGFFGTGFLDYTNASNDFVKWTINVNAAGTYELSVRYALASGNRPLKMSINDEVRIPSITFPTTGSWSNWSFYKTNQSLNAGNNTIALTAIGGSGPNVDQIAITNTLGLNDANRDIERSVVVFPNPLSDGKLTVSFDNFDDDTNLRMTIATLSGQIIYRSAVTDTCHMDLDLSGKLNDGVHLVIVESDQTKVVKKLIVKK
ncbi:MAG: carbohydrate-binding protein [Flavobacterium sp.]|nr:carbohydrate-binding protein [Flavobacterium sp.]